MQPGNLRLVMTVFSAFIIIYFGLFITSGEARDREFTSVVRTMPLEEILKSKQTCEECHARVTPGVFQDHQRGVHAKEKVTCTDCHGSNHAGFPPATAKRACEKCHPQEVEEFMKSKHAQSWANSWENARYQMQSPDMRDLGCNGCHNISYGWQDARCDYCHGKHKFSAAEARQPAVCATCHMGPDHPQIEAYEDSPHGKAFAREGKGYEDGGKAPTCVTCHQPKGTHDVSTNISIGGVSLGAVLAGDKDLLDQQGKPYLKAGIMEPEKFRAKRAQMEAICLNCHPAALVKEDFARADRLKKETELKVIQAKKIIEGLNRDGLIFPNPEQ
ncbi:MAG: multiheme c-type cytochrome, partial [Clostridia bacterium]|nr:multiheme c-type cytochrome [Clostridia bacterium]